MGRKHRSEVTNAILCCIVSNDKGVLESDLEKDVKAPGEKYGFHVDHSTFHDHLNFLEKLGFLSEHPFLEAGKKVPRIVIKPKLLAYLYALYRLKCTHDKVCQVLLDGQLKKLLELLRNHLADHFKNYMESMAKLCEEDSDLSVLAEALGQILANDEKRSIVLDEDFLAGLAKETVDLDKLEEQYPRTMLGLYRRVAEALIQFLCARKDLKSIAEAWLSTLRDVLPTLPVDGRAALAASIKSELYPHYAKIVRGLPPGVAADYKRKIKSVRSEKEMVLLFQCSKCSRINITVKNVFELIKREEVECEACGHKTPFKSVIGERFLKWAEEKYIPRHLMPALTKLINEISVLSCRVLVYRNIAICGAKCTIEGEVEPPHPGCIATLTIIDPEGLTNTFNVQIDADGKYRFDHKFEKLGVWSLRASWNGDEDHLGAYSENVEFLVYKLD